MDTIFAVSSGPPPAAISIIRISGPDAMAAVEALAGDRPLARRATVRALRDAGGALLDRALVIVFPGPATATGEDLAELHCHGGRAVVAAVQAALADMAGLRLARPGEFTRRALANGRIDLTEAEGLADLLEAETESQRVAALGAAEGRISRQVRYWLDGIAMLSARVEAMLDYAEDGDVSEEIETVALREGIGALADEMRGVLASPPVDRLRDGVRVVIAGPPNSGKSTLLNLLCEREAAIVSPISGTTRDRIEAPVMRNGIAYVFTDTAGLTETDDAIEAIGVERAGEAIRAADILLWMGDDAPPRDDAIWIRARRDVEGRTEVPGHAAVATDRNDRSSIERLWMIVAGCAGNMLPRLDAIPLKMHQRATCLSALSAIEEAGSCSDLLIAAEHLRMARSGMAHILGLDSTELALDQLFARFCLGK